MVPRSLLSTFAACLLFTSSIAAPAAAPDANPQPHAAGHKAARYAKSFIYERRQVPTHPTSTKEARDVEGIAGEAGQLDKRWLSHHGAFPHGPHPNFWHHGPRWSPHEWSPHHWGPHHPSPHHPSSPQPSSSFSLPPIPMKERRNAPYAYLNRRDPNAFAYPDHGYEGFYKAKRDAMWGGPGRGFPSHHGPPPGWGHGPPPFWGHGPAMPMPSSGFHLPQWRHHSHHSPYEFGHERLEFPHKTGPHAAKETNQPNDQLHDVKAPTNVKRDEGMPRYAMGY